MLWHPLFSFSSAAAPAPPIIAATLGGGTSRRLPDRRMLAMLGDDRAAMELVTVFLEFIDDETSLR